MQGKGRVPYERTAKSDEGLLIIVQALRSAAMADNDEESRRMEEAWRDFEEVRSFSKLSAFLDAYEAYGVIFKSNMFANIEQLVNSRSTNLPTGTAEPAADASEAEAGLVSAAEEPAVDASATAGPVSSAEKAASDGSGAEAAGLVSLAETGPVSSAEEPEADPTGAVGLELLSWNNVAEIEGTFQRLVGVLEAAGDPHGYADFHAPTLKFMENVLNQAKFLLGLTNTIVYKLRLLLLFNSSEPREELRVSRICKLRSLSAA